MNPTAFILALSTLAAAVVAQAGTLAYTYDAQNRLVAARTTANLVSYGYDAGGNVTGVAYPGTVQLVGGDRSTYESAGSVSFSATRTNGSEGVLSVPFATTNLSAIAALDFTAVNGSLTWADGETGTKTFQVTLLPDALSEPYGETLRVDLLSPQPPGVLLSPSSAVLTIYDRAVDLWRVQQFGTPYNSGLAADLADYDGDGISNLLEYAMNLNPTILSSLPASHTLDGTNFEFTYTRSSAAQNAGTIFTVEWSDTLPGPDPWSTAGVSEQILSDNGTVQQVKATIPAGSGGQRFVHLKVTDPP